MVVTGSADRLVCYLPLDGLESTALLDLAWRSYRIWCSCAGASSLSAPPLATRSRNSKPAPPRAMCAASKLSTRTCGKPSRPIPACAAAQRYYARSLALERSTSPPSWSTCPNLALSAAVRPGPARRRHLRPRQRLPRGLPPCLRRPRRTALRAVHGRPHRDPPLAAFYQRLRDRGKQPRLALEAVMGKLADAILRAGRRWQSCASCAFVPT